MQKIFYKENTERGHSQRQTIQVLQERSSAGKILFLYIKSQLYYDKMQKIKNRGGN